MKTIKAGKLTFNSMVDDVFKQFDRNELINRKKAGVFLARRIRKNIGKRGLSEQGQFPGVYTGNLKSSIRHKVTKGHEVFVGAKSGKGSHAHLLEFGHEPNKQKSKRPFLFKTFVQEKNNVIDIMSQNWDK